MLSSHPIQSYSYQMRKPVEKTSPWIRWQHRAAQTLLRPVLRLYYGWSYRYHGERYREEDPNQPYLILSNHNGAVDPILLALSCGLLLCGVPYFIDSLGLLWLVSIPLLLLPWFIEI